jgi:outer membrane protein OmpA-like peptidoglycan-associated protein
MAARRPSSPEEELKHLLLSHELDLLEKLEERLASVQDRVGDDKVFQRSVRRVIVDALREAGVEDHERLSSILAPLVLSSLREEIRGSRDMMVEALYPLTGRLVSAAVRNAFRELLERIDTTLSQAFSFTRLRIRAQALLTRRSQAELLLQRFPFFELEDGLVVHRPTGLLVVRTGEDDPEGEETGQETGIDSDLVGGMLSAIMSFTKDAFGEGDSGELSTLEFGDSTLFMHSSPTITLAVKTSGTAPASFDGRLERAFVGFLDRWGEPLRDFEGELDPEQAMDMAADLRSRLRAVDTATKSSAGPKRPVGKAVAVLAVLLLVLFGFQAKRFMDAREAERREASIAAVESTARDAIARDPAVLGYPIQADYDRQAEVLRVRGLVPGYEERDSLRTALTDALPDTSLDYQMNTLPKAVPPATDRLQKWARANVIFFTRGATPRDEAGVQAKLVEAAKLLLGTPAGVRLRVVGYADPLGSRSINERLTRQRAEFAASGLEKAGVPRERLVVVGRPGEQFLTNVVGAGSESRRVEFEVVLSR